MPEYLSDEYLAPSKEVLVHSVMDPSSWVPIFDRMPALRGPRDLPRYVVTVTSIERNSSSKPSRRYSFNITGKDFGGRTFAGSVSYEDGLYPMYGGVMVVKWDEEPKQAGVDGANDSDARDTKEFVGGTCVT